MKILIVEDQFYNRLVLKRLMQSYGTFVEAMNGLEAVDKFCRSFSSQDRFDLILMDIMMPELDGLEALNRIRDFESSQGVPRSEIVRIVMLTALGDSEHVKKAMYDGGADAYLIKPVQVQKLNLVLNNLGFDPVQPADEGQGIT